MKDKLLAAILLIAVIAFVIANTLILRNHIQEIIGSVRELNVNSEEAFAVAKKVYDDYKDKEKYMSLTVNHDDLTNIEDCFVELIGYLAIKDNDSATVTKSRLISYLEHLRRLSGFNIDAVI